MSSSSRSGEHSSPDLRLAARPFGTMSTPTERGAAICTTSPATDEAENRACAVARSSVPESSTLARPPGVRSAKPGNGGQPVRDRGRSGTRHPSGLAGTGQGRERDEFEPGKHTDRSNEADTGGGLVLHDLERRTAGDRTERARREGEVAEDV